MPSTFYNKFRRITTNQAYFPEIDGIRFLAIVIVILFHSYGYFLGRNTVAFTDDPAQYHLLNTFLLNGDRGVEFFFVLSGFVLCLPFAHHYINSGKKILLKKYYLRRVTRLEPPYVIAITALFLLQLAMHIHPFAQLLPSWLASLVYGHGLIYHRTPLLTVVAWSLEIEIQFYVVAPLLFSLLALPVAARRILLAAATCLLITAQHFYPPTFLSIYGFAQYFFMGILLADFYVSNAASNLINKKWMALPALLLLIISIFLPVKDETFPVFAVFLSRLALPFVIGLLFLIILKNDVVKPVFSYKFVPIIGGMCYSIYLLHYSIISIFGRFTMRLHLTSYYLPNLALQMLLLFIPILAVSALFYYYIERPFMSSKWLDMLMKKHKKEETANMQSELPASKPSAE